MHHLRSVLQDQALLCADCLHEYQNKWLHLRQRAPSTATGGLGGRQRDASGQLTHGTQQRKRSRADNACAEGRRGDQVQEHRQDLNKTIRQCCSVIDARRCGELAQPLQQALKRKKRDHIEDRDCCSHALHGKLVFVAA